MVWWGQSESLCYKCLFWRDQGQQIAFAILRGHFHLMDCLGASSTCPAVPYHQAFPYWYVWSLKSQDFNLCPKWLAVHLKWYTYNNFTAWCVRCGGRKMQEECEVSFLCMWDWDTVSGGPFFDGGGDGGGNDRSNSRYPQANRQERGKRGKQWFSCKHFFNIPSVFSTKSEQLCPPYIFCLSFPYYHGQWPSFSHFQPLQSLLLLVTYD